MPPGALPSVQRSQLTLGMACVAHLVWWAARRCAEMFVRAYARVERCALQILWQVRN